MSLAFLSLFSPPFGSLFLVRQQQQQQPIPDCFHGGSNELGEFASPFMFFSCAVATPIAGRVSFIFSVYYFPLSKFFTSLDAL